MKTKNVFISRQLMTFHILPKQFQELFMGSFQKFLT